jgi:hypothetical protein
MKASQKKLRLLLTAFVLLTFISTPILEVRAASVPNVTLTSYSHTFYPLAGYKSVKVTYNEFGDGDSPPMTVSWSYNTAKFSVVVTKAGTSTVISNGQQLSSETLFDFNMTYIGSTCSNGVYYLTFSDRNNIGTGQATYNATVSCAYTPVP